MRHVCSASWTLHDAPLIECPVQKIQRYQETVWIFWLWLMLSWALLATYTLVVHNWGLCLLCCIYISINVILLPANCTSCFFSSLNVHYPERRRIDLYMYPNDALRPTKRNHHPSRSPNPPFKSCKLTRSPECCHWPFMDMTVLG